MLKQKVKGFKEFKIFHEQIMFNTWTEVKLY